MPNVPEDISENIIKFYLLNNYIDVSWECKGDLLSNTLGIIECKCFTSNGPISFSPSPKWDVIYFLDLRKGLSHLKIYETKLNAMNNDWLSIKITKNKTFDEQRLTGCRPRINWNQLHPQIEKYTTLLYDGHVRDILK